MFNEHYYLNLLQEKFKTEIKLFTKHKVTVTTYRKKSIPQIFFFYCWHSELFEVAILKQSFGVNFPFHLIWPWDST